MPTSFRPQARSGSRVSSAQPQRLEHLSHSFGESSRCLFSWEYHLADSWARVATSACEPAYRPPMPPNDSLVAVARSAGALAEFIATTAVRFRQADAGAQIRSWSTDAFAAWTRATAQGYRGPGPRPDWQVLRFATADRGRFIEVSGDLASATHVVVLVPGMTNELSTVDALRQRADRLLHELRKRARPGERVEVILWMGYRTPGRDEPWAAVSSDMARAGSKTLVQDLAAWRGVTDAEFTVVAHSYGTVLAGESMKRGLPAERLVVLGSPGISASTRAQLGSPKVMLYASSVTKSRSIPAAVARAATVSIGAHTPLVAVTPFIGDVLTGRDWASATSRYRVHGSDPAGNGFGAKVFPSSGTGHDAYFDPGSTGLATTAEIGLGRR
jgi:hypothetical protein